MQNAKIFWVMFSSIQNVEFIALMRASGGQNPKWRITTFFPKNCMVFSSILQNDGPKFNFFLEKRGTKHPLTDGFVPSKGNAIVLAHLVIKPNIT